jgi:hypothetical protein
MKERSNHQGIYVLVVAGFLSFGVPLIAEETKDTTTYQDTTSIILTHEDSVQIFRLTVLTAIINPGDTTINMTLCVPEYVKPSWLPKVKGLNITLTYLKKLEAKYARDSIRIEYKYISRFIVKGKKVLIFYGYQYVPFANLGGGGTEYDCEKINGVWVIESAGSWIS